MVRRAGSRAELMVPVYMMLSGIDSPRKTTFPHPDGANEAASFLSLHIWRIDGEQCWLKVDRFAQKQRTRTYRALTFHSDVGVGGRTAFQKALWVSYCSKNDSIFLFFSNRADNLCHEGASALIDAVCSSRIPASSTSSSRFPHRGVPQHLPRCSTGPPVVHHFIGSVLSQLHKGCISLWGHCVDNKMIEAWTE